MRGREEATLESGESYESQLRRYFAVLRRCGIRDRLISMAEILEARGKTPQVNGLVLFASQIGFEMATMWGKDEVMGAKVRLSDWYLSEGWRMGRVWDSRLWDGEYASEGQMFEVVLKRSKVWGVGFHVSWQNGPDQMPDGLRVIVRSNDRRSKRIEMLRDGVHMDFGSSLTCGGVKEEIDDYRRRVSDELQPGSVGVVLAQFVKREWPEIGFGEFGPACRQAGILHPPRLVGGGSE